MSVYMVNNVKVTTENFEPGIENIKQFIKMAEDNCNNNIKELRLKKVNNIIDMEYLPEDISFERTRRITGV